MKLRKNSISNEENQQPKNNFLKVALLNVRSIRNKTVFVPEYLSDKNIELCAITETWLVENEKVVEQELKEMGYYLLHSPRQCKKGGGVGILSKN